jgi:4-diphosphocytidyl-2-C-methyl-D-erythritol kinase
LLQRVNLVKTLVDRIVRCRAPAKLNMTLAVLGRRPDGFHDLESWVVQVEWFDELAFAPAVSLSLNVHGMRSTVPADDSNLVRQAATALADAAGRDPAAMIELEKHIAVGAGLGGGSSDAAATLLGLNSLWGLDWPVRRLTPIAAELGSDVPFFLEPGSAVIRGRGDRVERLAARWAGWFALVVPPYGVSTAKVYDRWEPQAPPNHRPEAGATARAAVWADPPGDASALSSRLFNDLTTPAFACEPRLARLHAALDGLAGRQVHLTGSGSCLFAIFDSEAEAEGWKQQASALLEEGDTVTVVRSL